jgi:rhodanese-related sulfurtransferase
VTFFLENWVLFVVAISSGAMLLWPVLGKGGGAAGITPAEAVQLMNREKAVVVDVCSPEEFASGHVTGAKNVPLGELEAKLPAVVKNKSVPVVMVCASGARSNRAVAVAKKLGYEKVHSLTGGMGAWRSASLPVQKG